jgi:ribonucleoside-diphosphate reductase alpha chain
MSVCKGLKIRRHFTCQNHDPYFGIEFVHTDIDFAGISKPVRIEYPKSWSSLAVSITARKYFRKTGVPNRRVAVVEDGIPEWLQRSVPAHGARLGSETSVKQLIERLAGAWTYWGWRGNYFQDEESARAFFDELRYIMIRQGCAPNSPQWFNTGLHWAYGIEGKATGMQFYVDPETDSVCQALSAYERPQPHACFIISVDDKLVGADGIQDLWHREAVMFKFGSGVGTNFSTLRAKDEPLSGGGYSSGLPSFLEVGDRSAGAIKSGGTTRRAAKMVILDVDHPDIEWFVGWKTREEEKVLSLIAGSLNMKRHTQNIVDAFNSKQTSVNNPQLDARIQIARSDGMTQSYIDRLVSSLEQGLSAPDLKVFDCDWQGEAYHTVSGQNSNNSVRVTDEFMKLVDTDQDFALIRRGDGSVARKVKAAELWDKVIYNAWASADPGLQFHDTINAWHTCPNSGPIRASNPCSEYMFLDNTACNLASINLVTFLKDGVFDCAGFEHVAGLLTVVLEISVSMASFPSPAIARGSYDFRTLGLGHANIGGMLMRLGIPYDSDQGRGIMRAITALMTGASYATSARMAASLGPFKGYAKDRENMLRVIRNHARVVGARDDKYEMLNVLPKHIELPSEPAYAALVARCAEVWREAEELGEAYGYRNAQATVIAPTGTIGLVMDCDTTGCEPDFALVKYKKMFDGGLERIVNQSVSYALQVHGYTEAQIKDIERYIIGNRDLDNTEAPINSQTLSEVGVSRVTLKKLQEQMESSHSLRGAMSSVLSDKESKRVKAVFTDIQFEESEVYYYGNETIEGAPHLRPDHLPIFDCADTCGPRGKRSLSWMAHVEALGALQPAVSGSISKTINGSKGVTVAEYKACAMRSWSELGLKCIAFYRDGAKSSQPLSSSTSQHSQRNLDALKSAAELIVHDMSTSEQDMEKVILSKLAKAQRKPLPARRRGYTQKVYIGGHKILLRTGEYEDGSLGEIFIDTHKEGATFRSLMNAFAMLFSLGLQYGIPLEEMFDAFFGTKSEPSGMVAGHRTIKSATSIFSFVVEELMRTYSSSAVLAKYGLISAPSATSTDDISVRTGGTDGVSGMLSDTSIYSGSVCPDPKCGSINIKRTGACETCQDCGANTGCG